MLYHSLTLNGSKNKQAAREAAIANLPPVYHSPLERYDREILNTPVEDAARLVRKGEWKPVDILRAYGKRAIKAHEQTNCLTEVMILDAEEWLGRSLASDGDDDDMGDDAGGRINLNGQLAGIPVSLKDMTNVKGYDSCIGYSKLANKPAEHNAPIIRLLEDAGAVPFVKTNVPVTLLSFECANDVSAHLSLPMRDAQGLIKRRYGEQQRTRTSKGTRLAGPAAEKQRC